MVLGILAVLGCLVPVLNVGSIVLALVGLALGIASLARRGAGRGMAVTGVVLAPVAIVGAVLVNVLVGAAVQSVDQAVTEVERGYTEVEPEAAAEADAQALAVGATAEVGDYVVTVTAVDPAADDVIAEANEFNDLPEGRYVLVDVTATYEGTAEEANPWIDLVAEFQGTDARNYSRCSAVVPRSAFDQPGLRTGGRAEYQVCFDVPVEAIAGGVVTIEQFGDFRDDRVAWALG
ncbi:DUF4190 domain-containing protein [Kineococcus sp. SYSU DK004]|uniref:DUF4190 domain-containing protein n=1 Tax=Kineococcus sp. SYSU DK004 TaxID=3383125 RepID=UPI003D7E45DE